MIKHITREGLKQMIDEEEDFVLINVLSEESYEKYHIPGSINVPWWKLFDDEYADKIPEDKTIVVHCSSFTCMSSAKAADILDTLGYNVIEFDGGIKDWHAAGYPLEGKGQ